LICRKIEDTSETDLDRLVDTLTERSVEILLDIGLLILVGVYEPPQPRPKGKVGGHQS
jgi:hypothetical protein